MITKDVCHVITLNKDVHLTTDAFLLVLKRIKDFTDINFIRTGLKSKRGKSTIPSFDVLSFHSRITRSSKLAGAKVQPVESSESGNIKE